MFRIASVGEKLAQAHALCVWVWKGSPKQDFILEEKWSLTRKFGLVVQSDTHVLASFIGLDPKIPPPSSLLLEILNVVLPRTYQRFVMLDMSRKSR